MPCLVALLALMLPRATIVFLYFITDWFRGVFDTTLWPVLGFLFMPTTLLWYSVVQNWFDGVWSPLPIAGMVVAVLIDSSSGNSARRHRTRKGKRSE